MQRVFLNSPRGLIALFRAALGKRLGQAVESAKGPDRPLQLPPRMVSNPGQQYRNPRRANKPKGKSAVREARKARRLERQDRIRAAGGAFDDMAAVRNEGRE